MQARVNPLRVEIVVVGFVSSKGKWNGRNYSSRCRAVLVEKAVAMPLLSHLLLWSLLYFY